MGDRVWKGKDGGRNGLVQDICGKGKSSSLVQRCHQGPVWHFGGVNAML